MARLEERGDSFRVAWRLGGKRDGEPQSVTFRPVPGATKADAKKLALAAKTLAESRLHAITRPEVYRAINGTTGSVPAGMPTFAEWAKQWIADRSRTNEVQPDTLATYERILRTRILPHLGHLHLTEISQDTIRDWVAWAVAQRTRPRGDNPGRPLSAKTVRRAHAVLHQVLGAAAPRWLPANPAARPVGARKNATGLPRVMSFEGMFLEPSEVQRILAHCSPAIHDLAYVAVRTGLRLGEVLVLRVEDVILTGKRPRIVVRRALKADGSIGDPKSEKSSRDVTISSELVKVLQPRVSGKRRTDLIFPAPKGGVWCPNNLRQRHWLTAVAEAQRCAEHPPAQPEKPTRGPRRKLRLDEVSTCTCPGRLTRSPRIHDLRHTHVSTLVELGWTPKRVQLRVGHASYQITMDVYGHLWEHGDDDRLDAMERLLAMKDDEAA